MRGAIPRSSGEDVLWATRGRYGEGNHQGRPQVLAVEPPIAIEAGTSERAGGSGYSRAIAQMCDGLNAFWRSAGAV